MDRREAKDILDGYSLLIAEETDLRHALDLAIEALKPVEDMGEVSDGYHTFNQLYHQRAVLFATIVNQNKGKAWKSWKHEDGKFCFDKDGEWFIVGIDTPKGSYTYHYEQKYWGMFDCEELDRGKHWDGHTEEDVTRLLSLPPVNQEQITGKLESATTTECNDCIWNICNYNKIDWETSEDCISRQQAIEALTGWETEPLDEDIVRTLESLPPVTPTERTGEWVPKVGHKDEIYTMPLICSECGAEIITDHDNYCGHCGAKMKGGVDNE